MGAGVGPYCKGPVCGKPRMTLAQGNIADATADMVNQPPHYASTRIECFDAISAMVENWDGESAFIAANVVKYIWRHRSKTPVESLKKARWYLDRLIALVEKREAAKE